MSSLDVTDDPTLRPPLSQPTPPPSSALHALAPLSLAQSPEFPTPTSSPDPLLGEAGLQSIDPQLQQRQQQQRLSSHPPSAAGPLDFRSPQPSATTPRHPPTATTHLYTGPTQAVPPPPPPPQRHPPPPLQTPQPYLHNSLMRSYHDAGSHASNQQQQQPGHPQHQHQQQQFLDQQDPAALQDAFASIRTFPLQTSPSGPPQPPPPPQHHHHQHQQQQQHHHHHHSHQQHQQHPQAHQQQQQQQAHQHHGDPRALAPPRSMPQEPNSQGPQGVRSIFPGGLGGVGGVEPQIIAPPLSAPQQQQPVSCGGEGNSRDGNLVGMPQPSRTPARGRNGGNTGITPGATAQITPIKDQNGKFPCPHCSKDYLHAKHLKRHLLRHTGDRPYACVLCSDTFSRSDILKRHFSKCSIRRGNPHGLTHLSHAHAHQRKVKEEKERAATSPSTVSSGASPGDGKKTAGKACDNCVKLKVKCDLRHPCERCRSKASECVYSRNQRRPNSMEDLHGLSSHPEYHSQNVLHGSPASYGEPFFAPPVSPHGHMPQQHSNHPLAQGRNHQLVGAIQPAIKRNTNSPADTTAFFEPHPPLPPAVPEEWTGYVQQPFSGPYYNPEVIAHGEMGQGGAGVGMLGTLYQPADSYRFIEGTWIGNPNTIPVDPLQEKCDRLLDFCFPGSTPEDNTQGLRLWITPDNLKHFVRLYLRNFQNHFPTVHVPTFNIALCHDGLLMAVMCTGAVYSERGIRQEEVRKLMDYSYNAMIKRLNEMSSVDGPARPPEVEDVHALQLIHVLFTWHGNARQRALAKQKYRVVVDIARRARLFRPVTSRDAAAETVSHLHQVYPESQHDTVKKTWNWAAWIEQERRNRCMYTVYLLDTAFVIYFNVPPIIRTSDICLPLPCDDAAWDARDATECANALGMGTEHQPGTHKPRQMEFGLGLQMLMTPGIQLPFCSTNAFSKFILIHAVNVQIWLWQKHNLDPMAPILDQWVRPLTKMPPMDPYMQPDARDQMFNNLNSALETWKKAWDEDFPVQYPDPASRIGFYRDGMPYYWVARRCIQKALRSQLGFVEEGNDQNVHVTVDMLRHVKEHIARAEQGRPIQEGAVAKIDQNYGVEDLTYDMKLLFRPTRDSADTYSEQRH